MEHDQGELKTGEVFWRTNEQKRRKVGLTKKVRESGSGNFPYFLDGVIIKGLPKLA